MNTTSRVKYYSHLEETLNIWSHAVGLLLSVVALFFLLNKAAQQDQILYWVAYIVYGLSQIAVFSASTFYHAAKDETRRHRLNIFDHSAIYLSIAGTYTPITLLVIPGVWGWSVFFVVWSMALVGIVLKLFFTGRFSLLSTISYVVMGGVIVLAIKSLIDLMALPGLLLLALGGVIYVIGAVLYQLKQLPYNHAIFHFFVLAAAICHFMMVYFFT
ncbi:PAQR family membrane homeostasis protein TrhA [Geofilum sp. OHC36d9]|uniref:PAQR family membrane homeostasis protein TrhA n=1 Tax=Geofilum sp. OHC36d9 TaxID=3458413 RepID=UPI0040342562